MRITSDDIGKCVSVILKTTTELKANESVCGEVSEVDDLGFVLDGAPHWKFPRKRIAHELVLSVWEFNSRRVPWACEEEPFSENFLAFYQYVFDRIFLRVGPYEKHLQGVMGECMDYAELLVFRSLSGFNPLSISRSELERLKRSFDRQVSEANEALSRRSAVAITDDIW